MAEAMAVRVSGGDVVRRPVAYRDEIRDELGNVVASIPVPELYEGEALVQIFGDSVPTVVRTHDAD